MFDCTQCGDQTPFLEEGVCPLCRMDNQNALDEHNARFDWWNSLSDAERAAEIRRKL